MTAASSAVCSVDKTLTVLFVDDERAMREIFAEFFSEDFDVRTAETGEQALTHFDREVDVVVTDRKMPGINGDELVDRLRAQHPDLPVIVISGVPCETGADGRFNCDNYLQKPVDFEQICTIISEQYASN